RGRYSHRAAYSNVQGHRHRKHRTELHLSSCPHSTDFTSFFFFNATPTTEIYTLSLHDALPICPWMNNTDPPRGRSAITCRACMRSEEHTSELQSLAYLVCRLLLEKKKEKAD